MTTRVAWIVGEKEESTAVLTRELRSIGYDSVSKSETSITDSADPSPIPDIILVNIDQLGDDSFTQHITSRYPETPVITLCDIEQLLFALETLGGISYSYLVRRITYGNLLKGAVSFAYYRISNKKFYDQQVKWMYTQIPQAILDVSVEMFFVDYEAPESKLKSQVRRTVTDVFNDLNDKINEKLWDI